MYAYGIGQFMQLNGELMRYTDVIRASHWYQQNPRDCILSQTIVTARSFNENISGPSRTGGSDRAVQPSAREAVEVLGIC